MLPWILALGAGPAAWVLSAAAGARPHLVEWLWGERVARWFAMTVGAVSGLVPFSVAELGGAALGAAVAVGSVGMSVAGWRAARWRGVFETAGKLTAYGLAIGSVGYAIFLLVWGVNARRVPIGETLGFPTVPSDVEELAGLYAELVEQSNGLRAQVPEVDGVAAPLGDVRDVLDRASGLFERASARWPLLGGRYARAKPVLFSEWMSAAGIAGIYIPFTGEANVSTDGPAFRLAFSAAHELAHQRGFTREDEANFVAYLVCREEGDLDFRYAASFMAQVYVAAALGEADYGRWRAIRRGVSPGVLADAEAYATWLERTRTRVADVTAAVNDTYLRSQGATGVRSYGEVVDLLLAERRTRIGEVGR